MDNENETSSSGGFGKDYHGQDAFGERMTGGGIGGDGHESSFDAPDIDTTELSTTDSSFEGEANEVADSMRESIRGVNEETAENSNTGSMDTSLQIGGTEEEDKERLRQAELAWEQDINKAAEELQKFDKDGIAAMVNVTKAVEREKRTNPLDRFVSKVSGTSAVQVATNEIENLSNKYGLAFDRAKFESDLKTNPDAAIETVASMLGEARKELEVNYKSAVEKSLSEAKDYLKSSTTDKTKTSFTDKMTKSKEKKAATPSEVIEAATSTEAKPGKNMSNAKTSPSDYLTKTNKDSTKEIAPNRISGSVTADESIEELEGAEEEDIEKLQQEYERAEENLNGLKEDYNKQMSTIAKLKGQLNSAYNDIEAKSTNGKPASILDADTGEIIDNIVDLSEMYGNYSRIAVEDVFKEKGVKGLREISDRILELAEDEANSALKAAQARRDNLKHTMDLYKSSTTDKTKTSFTDKMKPTEAKPGPNMANAKVSPSDYLTKANKDSTKELPPSRNDFGNHAVDTLKGVTDRIAGSVTADALGLKSIEEFARETGIALDKIAEDLQKPDEVRKGIIDEMENLSNKHGIAFDRAKLESDIKTNGTDAIKETLASIFDKVRKGLEADYKSAADKSHSADALGLKSFEEFARENGYNPEKLSTMKAYQLYQNKEIMKAIPGIVNKIGSYITERVKDAVDPSQLPERIRNTLARYNPATLIGAVILSIKSGAGLQASIDQALTMVDIEDQPAVSDYLKDVLNDEGTVNDLKTAFDDALAPEQNSDTNELDESIVDIGRKDNTDYSGFNAGLGTSGTTSDADVKVFIARNVKADPILRKMISKIGK